MVRAAGIPAFLLMVSIISCQIRDKDVLTDSTTDDYLKLSQEQRLDPSNATISMEVHEALAVSLFASEPMVINPTNMDIDDRGRIWVCESYNYAIPESEEKVPGGRITILEDINGDGKADKRTVYYQGEDVNIALGIAVLGNRVYISRSPDILVFTDEDGDDRPDKKEILFTGMGNRGDHSVHAIVFGPDGKFYFNMGNQGGPVKDSLGRILKDQLGKEIVPNGKDFIGGMIFRCNPDGSQMEVLGHNFRNCYEVAVDSYGGLWQSDNDDDGNKSCRINYILEYGNYGYLDEITRESWHAQRTNMEKTIPEQHWHQNDPGVVPNMLITGAGSPAGIMVYEGSALVPVFRNQPIHADAGPNVVRTYPAVKSGAGYRAQIENILQTKYDQWFRPVDVCAAPDGSLFVADWYDPGVGGGAAADHQKGRIFRIASPGKAYKPGMKGVQTADDAIEAIKNPNLSLRFKGWEYLYKTEKEAIPSLSKLAQDKNPVNRARAYWLLGKIKGKEKEYISKAFEDSDPDIRITGIRILRQSDLDYIKEVSALLKDPAPEVRREIAIGLHGRITADAANTWTALALQYDGKDRWYLEALGIGADQNWDACLKAWLKKVGDNWKKQAGRNIISRSRSKQTPALLSELVLDSETNTAERLQYFRAFDFQDPATIQPILAGLLNVDHPAQKEINRLVLFHIHPEEIRMNEDLKNALHQTLLECKGTPDYLWLVRKYKIRDQNEELLMMAMDHAGEESGSTAMGILLNPAWEARGLVNTCLLKGDSNAVRLVRSMQYLSNREATGLLSEIVLGKSYTIELKKEAILALGKSWPGESALLECVKNKKFDKQLNPVAASVLFNVYRVEIQEEAAKYIPKPQTAGGRKIPPVRDLLASVGNAEEGKPVFEKYCQTCHQVNQVGTNFGPPLGAIGGKLSREGLFRAILYPSEGISYNYEGYTIKLKNGNTAVGIIDNRSKDFLELKSLGDIHTQYSLKDIDSVNQQTRSLMPDLSSVLTETELVNLVSYLSTLK